MVVYVCACVGGEGVGGEGMGRGGAASTVYSCSVQLSLCVACHACRAWRPCPWQPAPLPAGPLLLVLLQRRCRQHPACLQAARLRTNPLRSNCLRGRQRAPASSCEQRQAVPAHACGDSRQWGRQAGACQLQQLRQ